MSAHDAVNHSEEIRLSNKAIGVPWLSSQVNESFGENEVLLQICTLPRETSVYVEQEEKFVEVL